jgi:hypothetical protein
MQTLSMDVYRPEQHDPSWEPDVADLMVSHQEEERTSLAKRDRPSPADTEDELLEAAGIATKRYRED